MSCEYCNYSATSAIGLKIHKNTVHEGDNYSCDKCEYKTTWKGQIKTHQMSIHGEVSQFYFLSKKSKQSGLK